MTSTEIETSFLDNNAVPLHQIACLRPDIHAEKSANPRNDRVDIGNVLVAIEFQPNQCSREILVYRAICARPLKGIFMPLRWDSPAQ